MGAWGPGPFENDDAMDFIDGLSAASPGQRAALILEALTFPDGYVEMPAACLAVAAAGLVAAAGGMPADGHEDVAELIGQGGIPPGDQVRGLASAALSRVAGEDSEWPELWEDGRLLAQARAALDQVRRSI